MLFLCLVAVWLVSADIAPANAAVSLFDAPARYAPYLVDTLAGPGVVRTYADPFLKRFDECVAGAPHANSSHGPLPPHATFAIRAPVGSSVRPENRPVIEWKHRNTTDAEAPRGAVGVPNTEWIAWRLAHAFDDDVRDLVLVSFTLQSDDFAAILNTWIAHALRVGVQRHVLFLALEQRDCDAVTHFAPCILHDRAAFPARSAPADVRWLHTWTLLRAGYNVLQCDADALFMANPFFHLPDDAAVAGLVDKDLDGVYGGMLDYCAAPDAPCQSTGFTFMESQPDVLRVVSRTVEALTASPNEWEQRIFNVELLPLVRAGKHHALPRTGDGAFSNWQCVRQSMERGFDITPAVVHAGYVVTQAEKWATFRCAQLGVPTREAVARVEDGERGAPRPRRHRGKPASSSECPPYDAFYALLNATYPESEFATRVPTTLDEFYALQHQIFFAEGWHNDVEWHDRRLHNTTTLANDVPDASYNARFMGMTVQKYPSDMWLYQELFWNLKSDFIIECGTLNGAAAAYYAMVTHALLPDTRILSIDFDRNPGNSTFFHSVPFVKGRVTYLQNGDGDIDPENIAVARQMASSARSVIVFVDSDHSAEHVLQVFDAFAPLVTEGSYMIAEDANLDNAVCQRGLNARCGGAFEGPGVALQRWLPLHPEFEVDRAWERRFHLTQQPGGWLRRVTPAEPKAARRPRASAARGAR